MSDAPRGAFPQLALFVDLLLTWNRTLNLIGRADARTVWQRHVHDSLQLIPLMPPSVDRAIDLGSGAGFPGLILACSTGIHFDLVESDQRKAAFLREAARATQAPVTIHASRIEAVRIAPAQLITARALAPLPKLLSLAAPLMLPNAICLFPKGQNAEAELTASRSEWHMRVEQVPSGTAPEGVILRISEIARADRK